MRVTLTVDGACHDLYVNPGRTLADILETECGVTGKATPNTSAAASPVIVALRTG
jgi:aerobic-type carbon monoxide dehydrogenase small subunit (CoxS/CutS family)